MFSAINLSEKYLNALLHKQSVISNNISNVDTPGYKRRDIRFNLTLNEAMEKGKVDELKTEEVIDMASFSYRMDGNNVDIDKEMGELSLVKVQYDTMAQRAASQLNKYKTLLQNIK